MSLSSKPFSGCRSFLFLVKMVYKSINGFMYSIFIRENTDNIGILFIFSQFSFRSRSPQLFLFSSLPSPPSFFLHSFVSRSPTPTLHLRGLKDHLRVLGRRYRLRFSRLGWCCRFESPRCTLKKKITFPLCIPFSQFFLSRFPSLCRPLSLCFFTFSLSFSLSLRKISSFLDLRKRCYMHYFLLSICQAFNFI